MMDQIKDVKDVKIGVIGLGYVGLPLAVEFGKKYPVIGFDINALRIAALITFCALFLKANSPEIFNRPIKSIVMM
jgi:UDP-N-acetyl-D-galactosamine dehydrogenase